MERYESKHVRISHPAERIYGVISRFDNLSPVLGDKVEEWEAGEDTCSFKVKGFNVRLRMVEKESPKLIKVVGEDGSPMEFMFWIQLVSAPDSHTHMRIVLDVKLNMVMKMMVGDKLSGAVDMIAEKIAEGFNNAPMPEHSGI